jgi:hypothetical protein
MFMNDVGTGDHSSSIHHPCCSRQTKLAKLRNGCGAGRFVTRAVKWPTKWIEPNNQNAALFIFELSRMTFLTLRFQVERTAPVSVLAFAPTRLY